VSATTTAPAEPSTEAASPARTSAEVAITRRSFRQLWIGATVCALVFAGTAASSALTYVTTFPTEAARQQVALITSNDAGLAILLGPVTGLDTVGGYTVYKGFVFLTTIGAIWALLAGTKLLRGEEDEGRWELVLAGRTRASRATAAVLVALAAAVGVIFLGTTVLMVLAGRNPDVGFGVGETVLYGASLALVPAVFAAVGAVTSQLGRTRRAATTLAMAVFAVAMVVRMMADASADLHWLRWATPFGWTELMAPFTENNAWPLLPAAITVVVLSALAIGLAARRDVGAGVFASSDVSAVRPFGLRSPFGLAVRLERGVLLAWCVGALATGLALGVFAEMTTSAVPESMLDMLDKFGVEGSFSTQFFGIAFLLLGTVVALLPASQIGGAADEETSGRVVEILTAPVSRSAWFCGRLVLGAAAVVVAAFLGGLGAWLGAKSQGLDLGLATMLTAGLNLVPTALVALGIGAVALALNPRAGAPAVYGIVLWSLLIDLLGSMVTSLSSLEKLSLFHYMALAPAQDPVPSTVALTLVVAVGLGAVATLLLQRRDMQTG
jgi:ABC-2 type transport system permease protein